MASNKGPSKSQVGDRSFPRTLYEIVSDEETDYCIHWLPSGTHFVVSNKVKFAEEVLPTYFDAKAKYTSFTRRLKRWNFKRISSGPQMGAYLHPCFLRDRPDLVDRVSYPIRKAGGEVPIDTLIPLLAPSNDSLSINGFPRPPRSFEFAATPAQFQASMASSMAPMRYCAYNGGAFTDVLSNSASSRPLPQLSASAIAPGSSESFNNNLGGVSALSSVQRQRIELRQNMIAMNNNGNNPSGLTSLDNAGLDGVNATQLMRPPNFPTSNQPYPDTMASMLNGLTGGDRLRMGNDLLAAALRMNGQHTQNQNQADIYHYASNPGSGALNDFSTQQFRYPSNS